MGKILVKASPQIQIGPDGKPQMYYNVGFGGRRGEGDGARGRTMRSRLLGAGGAALGALGGLAGESRSLGGFLSNLQVGAMQGGALGRRIADSRLVTPRRRQARADILESEKQARARSDAEAQLAGEREMKRRRGLEVDPNMSLQEMRDMGPTPRRRRVLPGIGGRNMTQFGHELAAHREEQEAIAAERARQQKELDKQGFKGDVRQFMEAQKNLPSQQVVDVVGSLAGTAAPVGQQPQAPQQIAPLSQETQNQITQGDTLPSANAQYADSSPSQRSTNIELPDDEGDENADSAMLDKLRGMMEGENE